MYGQTTNRSGWGFHGAAAIVATIAATLLATTAPAKDKLVTVGIHVSDAGLNLNQPADARAFYTRLENAAWVACTRGDRVDLLPVDSLKGCYENTLGDAIRSAKRPMLTQIYLETHTLRQAAAHGIEVPVQQIAGIAGK